MPDMPSSLDRPFTVPLLIRGSTGGTLFGGLLLMTGVFFASALLVHLQSPGDPLKPVCLFFGTLFGVSSLIKFAWAFPRRRWLEVSRAGFVISSPRGKVVYDDEQVVGLSFRPASGGNTQFEVTIETDRDDDERIRCSYVIPRGTMDPLTAFWQRVQHAMIRRVTARLDDGASLTGVGWRFDAFGFEYRHRRTVRLIPIEKIQKAGFFDGFLCLWKDDDERPFLRVAGVSRNVGPLATLIWGKIGDSSNTPPLPGRPLGRIVLRRRSADLVVGIGGFLLIAGCTTFGFLPRNGTAPRLSSGAIAGVACFASAFASPFFFFVWRGLRYRAITFHEYGVSQSGWGRQRSLLFTEIETLTCDGNVRLDFLPAPGSPLLPIRFRHCVRKIDPDLALLMDHLSKVMVDRMGQNMTEPIPWTAQLRFLPGGLECKARGMLGTDSPITVPFQLTTYQIVGQYCFIFVVGQAKPIVKELMTGPNFYPGLYLLNWITTGLRQAAVQPDEARPGTGPQALRPPQTDGRFMG